MAGKMGAEATAAEQFGPYVVYERLGIGGMATVHRAVERAHVAGFERVVALKRLLPHLAEDATFIKAFVREAKLAALLTHVNISQIYDLGRVDTQYFISMEYIDGCDLRRILRHARSLNTPPPIHVTVGILLQLCDALDYAHNKTDDAGVPLGLVHRDVSPSNLLLTTSGHLKVIDFGIAKAQSLQLRTQTGRVKGKLAYMAPEAVLASREIDARSDLWAVGVILHELLTARPLFWSKNEYQTLIKIEQGDITPPSILNPNCPLELDAIVATALARDVNQRFRTAADIRNALMRVRRDNKLATTERDIAQWLGHSLASILSNKASSSPRLPHPDPPASPPILVDSPPHSQALTMSRADELRVGVLDDVRIPASASRETSDQAEMTDPRPHSHGSVAHPGGAGVFDPPPHSHGSAAHPGGAGVFDPRPHSHGSVAHPGGAGVFDPLGPDEHTIRSDLPGGMDALGDGEMNGPLLPEDSDSVWGTELADRAVVLDEVPDVGKRTASPPPGSIAASAFGRSGGAGPTSAGGAALRTGYGQAVRFSTFFPKPAATTSAPAFGSAQSWMARVADRFSRREPASRHPIRSWWLALALAAIAVAVAAFTLFAVTTDAPVSQPTRSNTHGTIEIVVEPGDAIIKVGQLTHTGSPWKIDLPAGTHHVVVDRLNYQSWRASIDLSIGELQRFRLTLQPSSTNADPADADAALAITTIPPGLELIVDGQLLSQRTPITMAIPPGDHAIVLRQAGIERWWQGFRALPASSYEFSPVFSTASP